MSSSTKPYLIRAIYDWCVDNNLTPHISVAVHTDLDMPTQYVNDGEIVFNISFRAAHDLVISNHQICFMARFNGVPRKLEIPIYAVKSIFAREVNQGLEFPDDRENETQASLNDQKASQINESTAYQEKNLKKPSLRIIK